RSQEATVRRPWAPRAPAISGSSRQARRPWSGPAREVIRAVKSAGRGHATIPWLSCWRWGRVSTPIVAGEPFRAYPASATSQVAKVLSESAAEMKYAGAFGTFQGKPFQVE